VREKSKQEVGSEGKGKKDEEKKKTTSPGRRSVREKPTPFLCWKKLHRPEGIGKKNLGVTATKRTGKKKGGNGGKKGRKSL